MKGFNSASEFGAAAAGQVAASLLSPESYVGWSVKGASWGVRAMKAALQQAGIAGAADLETQRNLVEAGVQPETDWRRTLGVMATGGVAGAIGSKNGSAKSGHVGITPEGPPQHPASSPDAKVEGTPVASGPDAPSVTPPDVPGSPVPPVATSDSQALVPQEAPTRSSVPDGIELAPSGQPKQQAPIPEGVPKQEQPLGVRGEEPAPVAPTVEGQHQAPDKSGAPVVSTGKNPSQLSSERRAIWSQMDLAKHENGKEYHPLSKHSGMSFGYLENRLKTEKITAASTFHNDAEANYSARLVLDKRAHEISIWFENPKYTKPKGFQVTMADLGPNFGPIGSILERKSSSLLPGTGVKIVIEKNAQMPEGFRVITAYPIR